MGLLIWLVKQGPPRKKRAMRYANPGLVAYYWDGGAPKKHAVKDISPTGVYVYTKELWCVGTIVALTLQDAGDREGKAAVPPIVLPCRVVRHGEDGIGFNFMFQGNEARKALKRFMRSAGFQESRASGSDRGQALVEFALTVPLLFLLIINVVNFGGWIYGWIAVANAARAGANYAAIGASSVSYPREAMATDVVTLTQNETGALPNWSTSNPTITVCQNYNGTATLLRSTSACPAGVAPPNDPEAPAYTSLAIDVSYTYRPFIPLFDFPGLGIHATLPPSTIHRRTVMRILN
jgi:Flp pilus assembly protein TadG